SKIVMLSSETTPTFAFGYILAQAPITAMSLVRSLALTRGFFAFSLPASCRGITEKPRPTSAVARDRKLSARVSRAASSRGLFLPSDSVRLLGGIPAVLDASSLAVGVLTVILPASSVVAISACVLPAFLSALATPISGFSDCAGLRGVLAIPG